MSPGGDQPLRVASTGLTYARRGLVGVLTPQANTTVEPELALLMPPGVAMLTARLTSAAASLEQRLRAYFEQLDDFIGRFAQAPLGVVVAAVTGSSYLIGPQAEDALFEAASRRQGVPVAGAALALGAALRTLGARRIALVSPYDAALTDAAVGYWQARGFDVVSVRRLDGASAGHHPIYALGGDAAALGVAEVLAGVADATTQARAAQAVLMLGTGMPTLPALAGIDPAAVSVPVLSSNLALAWLALEALQGRADAPSASHLHALLADEGWRARLRTWMASECDDEPQRDRRG
jgi:maleate cis-trans isomerase